MILIDNYDSFTYNIVQYLKELGVNPHVFKNDEISIDELKNMGFSSIIISPGPKNPDGAGISLEVIKEFHKTKKILGVCLGHQCIAQFFGAKIIKSPEPMHGKVSKIYFIPDVLFEGLEQGFEATRYHSLIVDNESLPECLILIAYADAKCNEKMENGKAMIDCDEHLTLIPSTSYPPPQGRRKNNYFCNINGKMENEPVSRFPFPVYQSSIMAIRHKHYATYGVQFHPEAILTQGGKKLLKNFLKL